MKEENLSAPKLRGDPEAHALQNIRAHARWTALQATRKAQGAKNFTDWNPGERTRKVHVPTPRTDEPPPKKKRGRPPLAKLQAHHLQFTKD